MVERGSIERALAARARRDASTATTHRVVVPELTSITSVIAQLRRRKAQFV